ncbi:hypothetical protein K431DRAFT_339961 [Polychaeton citri CBS 116435]|uniref:Ribosomal RNA-processing protein 8 n=1 Tax=Polychaeton citri CBS 116435 TaxID=1314669 RepID=A0A9P4UNZ9_9PEZI|nr:hypothetical protein K431DRAFT_339961 [Polychaeton citri CBS 116435]
MFAVKGWNLDASLLKAQQEAPKQQQQQQQQQQQRAANSNDANDGDKNGKKRKRNEGPTNVTEDNYAKLWEQVVEGKKPAKVQKKVEGGEKKAKGDGVEPKKSLKQKKRERKEKEALEAGEKDVQASDSTSQKKKAAVGSTPASGSLPLVSNGMKLTPMQSAMRQKLVSARFRHLNQTLYTEDSSKALSMFDQNPEMFSDYHAGFRQQVEVWPENPVDNFIATIRARGAVRQASSHGKQRGQKGQDQQNNGDIPNLGLQALPRTHGTAIIADLGCGDARLAETLTRSNGISKLNLKLHSFDLASPSRFVTKADISSLPLADGSVDVAIFCLALMGTNWISFIEEAYRILHWKGELWVAEIKSRFGRVSGRGSRKVVEHSVGSKRNMKKLGGPKALAKKQAEEDEVNADKILRKEVDGGDEADGEQDGSDGKQQSTDVGGFVDVLRRRGFVLKDGAKSVDLGNKMFVKMEFIKAAAPLKGKGKVESTGPGDAPGNKPGKKPRFVDSAAAKEDEVSTEDEGKALKPCLYKTR